MGLGLRGDQQAIYLQDLYKAEREAEKLEEPMYNKVFKVVPAKKAPGDKSDQLLGAGRLKRHEVEGQDIDFKAPVIGFSFYSRYWTFSDGLVLTKEAVEDTNIKKVGNILKDIAATWGESVIVEKETYGAMHFNDGGDLSGSFVFNGTHTGQTDPSGDLIYDLKPLFNVVGNESTTKGGGTYYNSVASLTLTPGNFETLYNRFSVSIAFNQLDRITSNRPDTLLTESGGQRFLAERIINTPPGNGIPFSQSNDTNVYYKLVQPMDWRYLSDSSAFYVGRKQHKDFQWHERQAPEIRFFRDETNRSYKASIDIRFGTMIKTRKAWVKGGGSYS